MNAIASIDVVIMNTDKFDPPNFLICMIGFIHLSFQPLFVQLCQLLLIWQ